MKIESIAATQLYGTAKAATQDEASDAAGFADALEQAMREMRSAVQQGEQAASEAIAGNGDIQSVVEALTATEMALETAVVVRDRVVEAYQEILRMPV